MLQQQHLPAEPPAPRCVVEKPKPKKRKKRSRGYDDCGQVVLSANILLYKKNMLHGYT